MIPTPPVDNLSIEDARKVIHALMAILTRNRDYMEESVNATLRSGQKTPAYEEVKFTVKWLDDFDKWIMSIPQRN